MEFVGKDFGPMVTPSLIGTFDTKDHKISFLEVLPSTYKHNAVTLLTERIFLMYETEFHDKNLRSLRKTLKRKAYPHALLESLIEATRKKFAMTSHRQEKNFRLLLYRMLEDCL